MFTKGTSSIDTTCTIWGLETGQVIGRVNMVTGQVKTQLIAHDKEVYDIAFSKGKQNILETLDNLFSVEFQSIRICLKSHETFFSWWRS